MYYYITCVMYVDASDDVFSYYFYPSKSYGSSMSEFFKYMTFARCCKEPITKKVESGFYLDELPRLIKELFLEV